ncbi:CRISPR-associated protein, Cmr4 family [Seinonella peptonophila]|uniref:CRISPR-associated protein, Cmr4 family n=1 Tax=Seinonella peptonophila TaxID=112248 RepID=A0A1M5A1G1_9BACL|nr:type III-B CRISPR module RAMP protein Cmr4 [Seinonella peptonophila]SHF24065.1 CRISPR-associated protein, Cmr4 family [Seinonella peptonophila]
MSSNKGFILGMLAETSIHPGTGQSHDVIQQPVAREATTQYPMIPSSSFKGALRMKAEQEFSQNVNTIFGTKSEIGNPDTEAGQVIFSDVRLILLPVRSLTGHYRWVTCPYLLQRLNRDRSLIDKPTFPFSSEPQEGEALTKNFTGTMFLEEFSFSCKQANDMEFDEMVTTLKKLIAHEFVLNRLDDQLVILHDQDFAHFARFGLPVRARNQLNNETKASENLWFEETLPPDTIMYSLVMAKPGYDHAWTQLYEALNAKPYIQVGGNETLGQGWFITSADATKE